MVQTRELLNLINSHDSPVLTEFFDIDVRGLDKFVKPRTSILSLVMLAKARDQGLDIVFVDEEKFFDGAFERIIGTLSNGLGPFERAWYIDFELAPVLLHGKTFCLDDYSESMGFGVNLAACNLTNEFINHYLKDTGKNDYGDWQAEGVRTIEQLAGYITRMLTVVEPKQAWYKQLINTTDLLIYLAVPFVAVGFVLYKGYRYINYLWNRPLQ